MATLTKKTSTRIAELFPEFVRADAAGVITSRGIESILMACLSVRQKAYAE